MNWFGRDPVDSLGDLQDLWERQDCVPELRAEVLRLRNDLAASQRQIEALTNEIEGLRRGVARIIPPEGESS